MSEGCVRFPSSLVGEYGIARSFELTPRRCTAFAAGVGEEGARYFDDTAAGGLAAHWGLAFAMQWQSHYTPGRPYDVNGPMWRHLLHAGSDLRMRRAFRVGEVLTCQGVTTAVQAIKPGVQWLQRYTMRDRRGAVVADLGHSAIIRGAAVEGPERNVDDWRADWEARAEAGKGAALWEAELAVPPTAPHVYTECARIWNPIHTERGVAIAAGLPGIVLHGTASLCMAVGVLVGRELGGDGERVRRVAGQYRALVVPGRPLLVRCLERREGPAGAVSLRFEALNDAGDRAIAGGVVEGA